MSDLASSSLTILTCTLAIAGWVTTFVGLCTSHTFTHSVSWWIIVFEFLVIALSCSVFWRNSGRIYYPVVLCLIAISIPYTTDEVVLYLSAGKQASLYAAASGYIIMMITQFAWVFLLGIQHEVSVLRSFNDLNQHRVYTNSIHQHTKEQPSNSVLGNSTILDLNNSSYPTPISQTPLNNQLVSASVPIYMNSSPSSQQDRSNTVFLSPHSDYLIPVKAMHNYQANKEDPNELSFTKGELLYIHEKRGSWWQAKKSNGVIGMIPSNYVTEQKSAIC